MPTPQQQNGNLPAVQTGAPGTVPVQFIVPEYLTHWGQVLKVVGSLEELGSWKVEKVSHCVHTVILHRSFSSSSGLCARVSTV